MRSTLDCVQPCCRVGPWQPAAGMKHVFLPAPLWVTQRRPYNPALPVSPQQAAGEKAAAGLHVDSLAPARLALRAGFACLSSARLRASIVQGASRASTLSAGRQSEIRNSLPHRDRKISLIKHSVIKERSPKPCFFSFSCRSSMMKLSANSILRPVL